MKPFQFMWALIMYQPWLYVLNGFIWLVIHLFPIVPGLLTRELLHTLTGDATLTIGVWSLLLLLLGVACGRITFIFIGALTDVWHRFMMSGLIRKNLFAHVLAQPVNLEVGQMVIQFREDAAQAEDAISWTLDVMGRFLFAICSLVLLLAIDVQLTLFVFVPLIVVVAIANMAMKRLGAYREKSKQASAAVVSTIGEMTAMSQAIQLARAESRMLARMDTLNEERRKTMVKDRVLTQALEAVFANTVTIGTGLILLLSAGAMQSGAFKIGDFVLFVFYLGYVTEFTQFFGRFLAHYRQTSISFKRMAALFGEKQAQALVRHTPLPLKQLPVNDEEKVRVSSFEQLRVSGLTYQFPGSTQGVQDASFTIKKGRFTVITGRVGAGKTTLLRTLLGQLPKQAGEVCWNGQRVDGGAAFFGPPYSAYTPQVPTLFSASIKENILLGKSEDDVDLSRVIEEAVLTETIAQMPDGIETIIGTRGMKLSGGQVQRVAIARMLACEADVFVLDDVSSALDVQTEAHLWENLANKRDRTYLVVSHRKDCLLRADHVIVMDEGSIVAQGTLAEVRESCEDVNVWLGEKK
ncbi:ABC transporter ATP-binding protein [Bacillus sp. FSL W7-1360]